MFSIQVRKQSMWYERELTLSWNCRDVSWGRRCIYKFYQIHFNDWTLSHDINPSYYMDCPFIRHWWKKLCYESSVWVIGMSHRYESSVWVIGMSHHRTSKFNRSCRFLLYWDSTYHPGSCLCPNQMALEVTAESVPWDINWMCHFDTLSCRNKSSV